MSFFVTSFVFSLTLFRSDDKTRNEKNATNRIEPDGRRRESIDRKLSNNNNYKINQQEPGNAVLDDHIAGMKVSERWEASLLQKEKGLQDLAP